MSSWATIEARRITGSNGNGTQGLSQHILCSCELSCAAPELGVRCPQYSTKSSKFRKFVSAVSYTRCCPLKWAFCFLRGQSGLSTRTETYNTFKHHKALLNLPALSLR